MATETIKEEKPGLKDRVDDLTGHIRDYAETYYKLTVLKVAEKSDQCGCICSCSYSTGNTRLFRSHLRQPGTGLLDRKPGEQQGRRFSDCFRDLFSRSHPDHRNAQKNNIPFYPQFNHPEDL